jgi:hypothetical protein
MLRLFAIVGGLLFAAISYADVCSYVTKDQAELGARLLRINPNLVKYCSPCSDKSKTKIRAEKIEVRPVENDQYWAVFVNEQNIDLAYTYLDIGEKNGISLANLSGCQTPYDVPRMIDIQTEVQLAPAETKPNVAMPTSTSAQDLLAQADQYFKKSDFAAAAHLYEQLLEKDQSTSAVLTPKIAKCYYNLGVQTIHKATLGGSKKDCIRAADYFSQSLFLDENDTQAKDALKTANVCKELGPNLPKVKDEIDGLEVRH